MTYGSRDFKYSITYLVYHSHCLSLVVSKYLSNLLIMSVPDENYSRDASCALNSVSTFLLHCIITGSILLHVDYFSQKA
jgi:hypothetical protein